MRRKIPDSHALLCFETAARHASFTHAAQELALTQSAVSRQITALESYLGQALFERGRHGVTLTTAGRSYARNVARHLRQIEQDTRALMSGHSDDTDVRLACVATFAAQWLIPRLADLKKRQPHITVHIETRTRPFMFADSALDAAIYAGTREQVAQWAGTRSIHLQDEQVVPVCSPRLLGRRKMLRPQDIAQLPLLQQSTRPDAWQHWFDAIGVEATRAGSGPRYELFSMSCAAAAANMGIALVPRLLVEAELARGELVIAHPTPLPSQRHYFLLLPETTPSTAAVLHFSDWLQDCATGRPATPQTPG